MGDPLADVVAELYALPPEEFTAARNERAKQAKADGDKPLSQEIGKLRKPSAAAWVLNQMVRHHRGEIDQFLAIGEALREAQAEFDADQLKELSRQRHQVVAAVARQARALSRQLGNPVSNAVEAEVEQTLRAALADPAAADAVSSGQLTKTLDYVGLGDTQVDLTGAVAVPGTAVATPAALRAVPSTPAPDAAPDRTDDDRAARRRAELEQARQDAEDGERAAAEADEDLATAERRVGSAEDRRGELEAQVADLERQVEEARDELAVAGRDVRSAGRDRDRAAKHADAAHVAADRARARVARLEERG
jgi:chromosome segregation ATPase